MQHDGMTRLVSGNALGSTDMMVKGEIPPITIASLRASPTAWLWAADRASVEPLPPCPTPARDRGTTPLPPARSAFEAGVAGRHFLR
jgi:hypothetical protein